MSLGSIFTLFAIVSLLMSVIIYSYNICFSEFCYGFLVPVYLFSWYNYDQYVVSQS